MGLYKPGSLLFLGFALSMHSSWHIILDISKRVKTGGQIGQPSRIGLPR